MMSVNIGKSVAKAKFRTFVLVIFKSADTMEPMKHSCGDPWALVYVPALNKAILEPVAHFDSGSRLNTKNIRF